MLTNCSILEILALDCKWLSCSSELLKHVELIVLVNGSVLHCVLSMRLMGKHNTCQTYPPQN